MAFFGGRGAANLPGQHAPQPAADANVPTGHVAQSLGAEAPAAATKRPAAQGVHAMAPVPPASYVPGAHGAHAVALAATAPAPHARHALPAEGAAKPAAQVVQEAGSWLALPGGHCAAVPHAAELAALYAPLAHGVHEVAPAAAEKVPGAQGAHESAPAAGVLVPAAQRVQLVAPLAAWARPGEHGAQGAPRKDVFAYRPGAHGTHAAPTAALPAGHAAALATQEVPLGWLRFPALHGTQEAALPTPSAVEAVPGGQRRHAAAEVALAASLYVPAPHSVQPPLPGAAQEPGAQQTAAPAPLPLPAGQGEHAEEETAAVKAPKRPAAQGWHADRIQLPAAALKVPAGQGVGAVECIGQ